DVATTKHVYCGSAGRSRTAPNGTSGDRRSVEAVTLACQFVGSRNNALAQDADQFVDLCLAHSEGRRHHIEVTDRPYDQAASLAVPGDPLADIHLIRQRLLRHAVHHVLDAQHEMAAANVADQRQRLELPQFLLEIGAERTHILADLLSLHDLDVL